MPDKAIVPAFDQCTSCAFASEKGSAQGPFPTSHTEVCCLYKFARQEQAVCIKHPGQNPTGKIPCNGLCESCPSRLIFPQPSRDAAQEGISTPPRKGPAKVSPRQRRGFKKLTIEIRPPKFKKKLWFGTFEEEDIDRAKDAINYYMCSNEPYILADSPLIFAQHELGIGFKDLQPSCEQFLQIGEKRVRASAHFARRVKDVIKTVIGKKSKKQRGKPRKLDRAPAATPKAKTQGIAVAYKPPSPCSPSSSISMPAASESGISTVENDMVWDNASNVADFHGASCYEAISVLATEHPQCLPTCQPTYLGDFQFEEVCDLQEVLRPWDDVPLDASTLDETDPQGWMKTFWNAELEPFAAPEIGIEDASFSFPSFHYNPWS